MEITVPNVHYKVTVPYLEEIFPLQNSQKQIWWFCFKEITFQRRIRLSKLIWNKMIMLYIIQF